MLSVFPYVAVPAFTGDIKLDVQALLYLNNRQETFMHVKAVAETNREIAGQYGLDAGICEQCGYLHDISAVISPKDMLAYALKNAWYIDEAERKHPFLLHQRLSREIALQNFGIADERILSAVACHTTLRANPSTYDMALFIADKLSWDAQGTPPFYTAVSDGLKISLEAASLAYMEYIVANKMILHPHKWFEEGAEFLRRKLNAGME